jgi:hypothetical protein
MGDLHFKWRLRFRKSCLAMTRKRRHRKIRLLLGSIAYFGSYTVTAADKTIHLHVERSSFSNLNGTDGRRIITALSSDQMNWTNPARFGGGAINCENKRI